MKVRTFVTTDDILTLQNCCDQLGVTLVVGGPPCATHMVYGFERLPEFGVRSRMDWSVVYLVCDSAYLILELCEMFQAQMKDHPLVSMNLKGKTT